MLKRSLLILVLYLPLVAGAAAPSPPDVLARAWLLADLSSDQVLAAVKADERVEPASLTKLMTVYLVFQALRDRKISLEQVAPVSVRAWKAPGSRMFIEPRRAVTVVELIQGVVVQSGNDACIALAELVSGSEARFVERMNAEAARLGMKNTRYMNASGLPDPQHFTTASDLHLLTRAVIRDFPAEYARYYAQKEYRYNNITQLNRNRLLWIDPRVDGVKTGHTEAAGYCLVSSAQRNGRRLVAVLLGSASEASRAQESLKLLNWGFQAFDSVKLYARDTPVKTIEVWKGEARSVGAGFAQDLVLTVPQGEADRLSAELLSQQPLVAPVAKDQKVGVLRVSLDGRTVGEFPLRALRAVPEAGLIRRAWDTLKLWLR